MRVVVAVAALLASGSNLAVVKAVEADEPDVGGLETSPVDFEEIEAPEVPASFRAGSVDTSEGEQVLARIATLTKGLGGRAGEPTIRSDRAGIDVPVVGLTEEEGEAFRRISSDNVQVNAVPTNISSTELLSIGRELAGHYEGSETHVRVYTDLERVAVVSPEPLSSSQQRDARVHAEAARQVVVEARPWTRDERPGTELDSLSAILIFEEGRSAPLDLRYGLPFRSGRFVMGTSYGCTGGFLWRHSSNGGLRASTAGHCLTSYSINLRMLNGSTVGFPTHIDPGGWDITATHVGNHDGVARVTVSSTGANRLIASVNDGHPNRSQRCWAGYGLWHWDGIDEHCGEKGYVSYAISGNHPQRCIRAPNNSTLGVGGPGDSGAVVYMIDEVGRAVGAGMVATGDFHPVTGVTEAVCYQSVHDLNLAMGPYAPVTNK